MNTGLKCVFTVALCLCLTHVFCQAARAGVYKKTAAKTTAGTGESVALSLKNLSDNQVILFAGPKTELSDKARLRTYGGQSINTIYVSVNEVVCIISEKGKPVSCADVVEGLSELEINHVGNAISAKE